MIHCWWNLVGVFWLPQISFWFNWSALNTTLILCPWPQLCPPDMALISERLLGKFDIMLLVAYGGMREMDWKLTFRGIFGHWMCYFMPSLLSKFLKTLLIVLLLNLSRLVECGIKPYLAIFFLIMLCWKLRLLSLLTLAARVISSFKPF